MTVSNAMGYFISIKAYNSVNALILFIIHYIY
jgi:hypothetical protein